MPISNIKTDMELIGCLIPCFYS